MQRCEGDRHRHHPNAAMRPNLRDNDDDQDTKQLAEQTLLARYEILNLRDSDKWVTLYIEKAKSKQCIFFSNAKHCKTRRIYSTKTVKTGPGRYEGSRSEPNRVFAFRLIFYRHEAMLRTGYKRKKKKPESEPHEDVSASITA